MHRRSSARNPLKRDGLRAPRVQRLTGARLTRAFLSLALLALSMAAPTPAPGSGRRLDGVNVIMVPDHPFGGSSAKRSLAELRRLGAGAIAVVPFLWQPRPPSPNIVRGDDMPDEVLRAAIRDAHGLGLVVVVKPQVWVPASWAGAVAMDDEATWDRWFANYQRELVRIARIAQEEGAQALAIGTELVLTTGRPEWRGLIADVRAVYSGTLLYVAHNADEAELVPFWDKLDVIGVSLYPPLGPDADASGRRATMRATADRLDALAAATGKSVVVAEIGLRSAQGAAARPWESAEERASPADPQLQAAVLADWLAALDRPAIRGIMIWRWLSDPDAGGAADTDFTVQHKPAERVLLCAWAGECDKR
jgi:hypothetical protein